MATVSVNLSQSVYNAVNIDGAPAPGDTANLADDLGLFFIIDQNFAATHTVTASSSIAADSARLNYADGGSTVFSGVVFADPNAANGTASATHVESYYPNNYRLTYDGTMNYHYALVGNVAALSYDGGTLGKVTLQTLLPQGAAGYSPVFGNGTISATGKVIVGLGGFFSGTVNEVSAQSEHWITSSKMTGSFDVSGNAISIGSGLDHAKVSGTLSGFDEHYTDGSSITFTNTNITVGASTIVDERLLSDANNWAGNDTINVTLPATLVAPWVIAAGAGNDSITIAGGGASLSVNGGSGNDSVAFGDDGHSADGGTGTDTAVFTGARAAYTVTKTADGYTVHANATGGGTDTLANFERLQFSDTSVAFDISGTGGQAYRIYQAAFNRTPDAVGLGFWIHAMDSGATLTDVATQFMGSKEFQDLYGSNLTTADFVDHLYQNVLHRAGDAGGVQFWNDAITLHGGTRAQALAAFGESQENQAALIGTIGNGFTFTHYG